MTKMEFEFSDEQIEKIEILKSNDFTVGEAIDLLFNIQKEIKKQIEENNPDGNILEKIQSSDFDLKIKAEIFEKEDNGHETYDEAIGDVKHNVKWSEFFKF